MKRASSMSIINQETEMQNNSKAPDNLLIMQKQTASSDNINKK